MQCSGFCSFDLITIIIIIIKGSLNGGVNKADEKRRVCPAFQRYSRMRLLAKRDMPAPLFAQELQKVK